MGSLLEPLLACIKTSKLCMLTSKEKFLFPGNVGFPDYTGNPDLLGVISKEVTLLNLEFLAIVLSPEVVLSLPNPTIAIGSLILKWFDWLIL